MHTRLNGALAAAAALALLAGACTGGDDKSATKATGANDSGAAATTATSASGPAVTFAQGTTAPVAPANSATADALNTVELVKRVRPSIVRVATSGGATRTPFGNQTQQGTGTGFIIDNRGYIVTNNHVVTLGTNQAAGSYNVDFADGRSLPARLVGRDERTDLAVLKVEGNNFTALKLADPKSIEVGMDVVAVGFALNLGATPTVTKGVVSAKDRVINETLDTPGGPAPISISGAVQTDAAINPGNSGGPLLNLRGEVVGINTAGIRGGAGGDVEGIGFAVSSQVAQPIVNALIEDGVVRRGFLGIVPATVDQGVARARNLQANSGALIMQVEAGSAAEAAGLRQGDVITKIGSIEISNVGDLTHALTEHGPGKRVKIEYTRGGDKRSADITPGERPNVS